MTKSAQHFENCPAQMLWGQKHRVSFISEEECWSYFILPVNKSPSRESPMNEFQFLEVEQPFLTLPSAYLRVSSLGRWLKKAESCNLVDRRKELATCECDVISAQSFPSIVAEGFREARFPQVGRLFRHRVVDVTLH